MTQTFPFDEKITSTETFESALKELLAATIQNGIDPREPSCTGVTRTST